MIASPSYRPADLKGKLALVAGATRGTGRGIALALGEARATGLLHRPQHQGEAASADTRKIFAV